MIAPGDDGSRAVQSIADSGPNGPRLFSAPLASVRTEAPSGHPGGAEAMQDRESLQPWRSPFHHCT
jgi:hypothetical protein